MKYDLEFKILNQIEDKADKSNFRKKLSESDLNQLRQNHNGISEEYLTYLKEIGSGSFKECQFVVQDYLFDLSELGIEDIYELKDEIKFFGDNFAGDLAGFDFKKNPNEVIEFWHDDGTIYETGKSFKEYIGEKIRVE